jgi:AraC-like DNA-binding protein
MTSFHHYLPINEKLFHDGFYVTGAGRTCVPPASPYPPKSHPAFYHFTWREGRIFPEFAIIVITDGKGVFESSENGLLPVNPGDVILLFPGIWHRYRPDFRTGWTEKWVQFNGEFVHKLWDRGILSAREPLLSPLRFREMEDELEILLTSVERQPGVNSLRYALQVAHLLSLFADSSPKPETEAYSSAMLMAKDELVAAAQTYIWTHSRLVFSVQDIATYLGATRRTLERRFIAALGHTVWEEVTRCRFNRAERLMRETSLPVKTVVYLSGFGRGENMRQTFTKLTRLSPRAYRAEWRSIHTASLRD